MSISSVILVSAGLVAYAAVLALREAVQPRGDLDRQKNIRLTRIAAIDGAALLALTFAYLYANTPEKSLPLVVLGLALSQWTFAVHYLKPRSFLPGKGILQRYWRPLAISSTLISGTAIILFAFPALWWE
jgi:hypothetical protein